MTKKIIGMALALLGSLALGVLAGSRFFHLFRQTVPPAVLTAFNQATAHAAFLGYGVTLGAVVFLWSLLLLTLSRYFRKA